MKFGLISEQSIMPDNIMVMYPEKHPRAHNGSSYVHTNYTYLLENIFKRQFIVHIIPTYWKTFSKSNLFLL